MSRDADGIGSTRQSGAEHAFGASRAVNALVTADGTLSPGPSLLMAHAPADPRCEMVRALRTELLLRDAIDAGSGAIALLSPCAGEGRSRLAAELAIAFAQTGRPTLLVDADLRNPSQQNLFWRSSRQGLTQALSGDGETCVQTVVGVPRLSVIMAGTLSNNPLELLSSRAFAMRLAQWRASFPFVVLDTAPIGEYSDGLAVASVAGSVLALCRADHTPFDAMRGMLGRLSAMRSRLAGVAISHF